MGKFFDSTSQIFVDFDSTAIRRRNAKCRICFENRRRFAVLFQLSFDNKNWEVFPPSTRVNVTSHPLEVRCHWSALRDINSSYSSGSRPPNQSDWVRFATTLTPSLTLTVTLTLTVEICYNSTKSVMLKPHRFRKWWVVPLKYEKYQSPLFCGHGICQEDAFFNTITLKTLMRNGSL